MAIRSSSRRSIVGPRPAAAEHAVCSWAACAIVASACLVACADLLDIPNQPQLVDQVATAAEQQPRGDAGPVPVTAPVVAEATPSVSNASGPSGPGSSDVAEGATSSPPLQTAERGTVGTASSTDERDAAVPAPSQSDPVDGGALSSCDPSGSVGPNGRCFSSLPALLTWSAAQRSCRALGPGWQLASIRSAEVNQFVAELLPGQAWLDGSDAAVEGAWRWLDDGLEFSITDRAGTRTLNGAYVNWNPGEPNGGDNSDCLRIVPALAATWADLQCDMLLGALCEGPGP